MIDYDPHRWSDHFFDIKGSMVREITGRVSACVLWSVIVVVIHKLFLPVGVPSTLHSLVGVAMGLLLVFRTNASYDRFWEGRKLWGGIVNETRNLVRAARPHLVNSEPRLFRELAYWTALFPYAAMNSLRNVKGLPQAFPELPREGVEASDSAQHPALAVTLRITECLNEARLRGRISDFIYTALDQNTQLLVDYLGGCERIKKTPLPFAYVVHLRRALVIYCFTLPFALVDQYSWGTILDVLLVSYTFFGIEEIGVEIEGPFGFDDNDLPLEAICDTIKTNVLAMVPEPRHAIAVASEQE